MATVAITGANSGIGLRAALTLAARGHQVLALCRNVDAAREALGDAAEIIETHMDDLDSVADSAAAVAARGVDALINNAAVFDLGMKQRQLVAGGHERVWATNHLGPTALAVRLADALADSKDGRAVFVGSKGILASPFIKIRWDDLNGDRWYTPTKAYYHSKLAQVMTAQTMAERAGGAISVSCIRVPAVRLDAAKIALQPPLLRWLYAPKNARAVEPQALGDVYATLATGERDRSVVYVDENLAECALPRFARDAANRERLADVTAQATGVDWPF